MKLLTLQNTWIIVAPQLVRCIGRLTIGRHGGEKALAFACFPFIVVKNQSVATPILINHEKIHFAQQIETLFIGLFIYTLLEDVYHWFIFGKRGTERYLWRSSEQEAYRNQENLDYIYTRPHFALFHYRRDKKQLFFIPDKAPQVIIQDC